MFSMYGTEQVMNKSFFGKERREGGRKLSLLDFTGLKKLWPGVKMPVLKSYLLFNN